MTRLELVNIPSVHNVISFGKHKGKTILNVLDADPSYLVWCICNVKDFAIDKRLKSELLSQWRNHNNGNRLAKCIRKEYGLNATEYCILSESQEI